MSIADARDLPAGSSLTATVAIIGSGPAGTTLALELARYGIDVLVLDGGGLTPAKETQDSLRGDAASQQVESLDKVREKRVGGTSHRWGGRTAPFDSTEFDGVAGPAWPITREELLPHYRRAAHLLDVGRWEWTAHQAIEGAPQHLFDEPSDLVDDEPIWRWSPPTKFGDVFRERLGDSPNVRLLHHANVTALHRDSSGRIGSVEVQPVPGRRVDVTAETVVVATGGLETARLLLHSGIGTEHDQVGRHFMIHPIGEVGRLTLTDPASAPTVATFAKSRDGVWVRRLLQLREEVRREHGLLNMGFAVWYLDPRDPAHGDALLSAFALARKALFHTGGFKASGMHSRYAESGDTAAHLRNLVGDVPGLARFAVRFTRDRWIDSRQRASFTQVSARGEYRIRFDAEQTPDPDNRVALSDETDAWGVPRLRVEHRVSEQDRTNMHRSLELLAEGINASGWARYEPPTLEEMLERPMIDGTHQMGLTRMGTSPTDSVVDADLRVWGVDNLHLATSGVFPTSGHAGPTMTIVALAMRLADRLVRR